VVREDQYTHISNQYDAGIREADDALAPLLDWLDDTGLLDDTLVILTSDHGEELGEHGQIGHERTLHREVVEIPLLVGGTEIEPRVVETPTGLVDLVPTILDLAGLPVPDELEGQSLRPTLMGSPGEETSPLPSELAWKLPLRSVVTPRHQLIENLQSGRQQLFDWATDPQQEHDLAGTELHVVDSLLSWLDRFEAAHPPGEGRPVESLSPEQRARLRSLGYVD
jgi:arylsulfatase A-like enzyme